jgi:predicted outer membrane protein
MRLGFAVAACALAALAACGQSHPPSGSSVKANDPPAAAQADTPEANFLFRAVMFETYEIQSADLAAARSQSSAVKTYAAAAAAEHRTILQQLTGAAHAAGVAWPGNELDENYVAYLAMLRRADAASIDTTYASQQAIAYMSASAAYDTYVSSGPDSPLKEWAGSQTDRLHDGVANAHALANSTVQH